MFVLISAGDACLVPVRSCCFHTSGVRVNRKVIVANASPTRVKTFHVKTRRLRASAELSEKTITNERYRRCNLTRRYVLIRGEVPLSRLWGLLIAGECSCVCAKAPPDGIAVNSNPGSAKCRSNVRPSGQK